MTLVKHRPREVVPPPILSTEVVDRVKPPGAKPPQGVVRWVPWMVALTVVIVLGAVAAIAFSSDDDNPATQSGTNISAPRLADVDPHESPEILRSTDGSVIVQATSNNAVVTENSVAAPVGGAPSVSIDPHESPEVLRAVRP